MRLKKDGKWIFEDKEAFEEWKEDISISSRLALIVPLKLGLVRL